MWLGWGWVSAQPVDSLQLALEAATDDAKRCELQFDLANAYVTNDLFQCVHYARLANATAASIADTNMMGQALGILAMSYQYHGDHETAMRYYLDGLHLCETTNNLWGIAATQTNIGTVYHESGNSEKAIEYFQSALAIYEAENDPAMVAQLLGNLGNAYSAAEQTDRAKASLTRHRNSHSAE